MRTNKLFWTHLTITLVMLTLSLTALAVYGQDNDEDSLPLPLPPSLPFVRIAQVPDEFRFSIHSHRPEQTATNIPYVRWLVTWQEWMINPQGTVTMQVNSGSKEFIYPGIHYLGTHNTRGLLFHPEGYCIIKARMMKKEGGGTWVYAGPNDFMAIFDPSWEPTEN